MHVSHVQSSGPNSRASCCSVAIGQKDPGVTNLINIVPCSRGPWSSANYSLHARAQFTSMIIIVNIVCGRWAGGAGEYQENLRCPVEQVPIKCPQLAEFPFRLPTGAPCASRQRDV